MPVAVQEYADFCSAAAAPPHLQPWWLNAVYGPGQWQVALARDAGGAVTGALPWRLTRRWGVVPVVQNPPFTAYAGPWLRHPDNPDLKQPARYAFEKQAFEQLIAQLPRRTFFRHTFHPEITNALPFQWAGFRQTVRYTYLLDCRPTPDTLLDGFKRTLRTDLKKAERLTAPQICTDPAPLFQLYGQSLGRSGLSPASKTAFFDLFSALHEHHSGRAWLALDRQTGAPHAGLLLAFDHQHAYAVVSGADPTHKASCAVYLLFWEAILFCHQRGLTLDFEGSIQPTIEHTLRAFGGTLTPYWRVETRHRLV